uniref:HTH_48 domain-containing protein n=1 Tax=Heterorhabditis bacteriophora TaxID=37862 RepID=A0A1I7WYR8_HETBA
MSPNWVLVWQILLAISTICLAMVPKGFKHKARGKPLVLVDDDVLRTLVEVDSSRTLSSLAKKLGVCCKIVGNHLKNMEKAKKLNKLVSHELSDQKTQRRLEICNSLYLRDNRTPFLRRILINRGVHPAHTPKPSLHIQKIIVTVWHSVRCIVHYSFLRPGQIITAESYYHEVEEVHKKLVQIDLALINRDGQILIHDNPRPHVAQNNRIQLNSPYSPDLPPTDYHLFCNLEHHTRNKTFRNRTEVEMSFTDFVSSKDPDFFEKEINLLETRWQECVKANGHSQDSSFLASANYFSFKHFCQSRSLSTENKMLREEKMSLNEKIASLKSKPTSSYHNLPQTRRLTTAL